MRSVKSPWASARRFGAAFAVLLLSLLSCGREVTGPADGVRIATGLSFVAEFPEAMSNLEQGAGDIVPFNRVRVLFVRADESIAYDQTVFFGASTDSLPLTLNIVLSPDAPSTGETLSLYLRYMNASGDTVFSGGPVQVVARPRRRGDPLPPPAQVELEYTGPGAEAVTVELSPDTLSIVAGDPFAFSAVARDGQGSVVSGAPIIYSALDAAKASLASSSAASGTSLATRGFARVRAVLAATGAADTAVLNIAPKPAALQRIGTAVLAGLTNSILADSVVVRLFATDNGPIANAAVNVVIEGGGGVNDTTLITDVDGRAAVQWTLGAAVGVSAQRLRFTSPGVPDLFIGALATAPTLVASRLMITQQPPTSAVSNVPFAPPLIVEARNSNNELVPTYNGSVAVSLVSGPAGGAVIGVASTSAVNGVATFSALTANLVGSYRVAVTSGALTPDTTDAFSIVPGAAANIALVTGGGQTASVGTQLPTTVSVRVTDAATNPVPNAPVTFAVTAGGGALLGASTLTDSLGVASLGAWTLGPTAGTQSITATVSGVAPLQINATAQPLAPVIELNVVGANVVGFQRTGDIRVRLLQPAPAGGLTVSVISDSTQYLTIAAPGNVTSPAGDTSATIRVTGVNVGTARVRATGSGYTPDTLAVPVTLNLISLPTTLNVALDGTVSLPVQISAPAPAGGIVVRLTSSANGTVALVTDSVVIAAGSESANTTLQGVTLGSATITASNPNYASDASTVSVTAGIDIVNTSLPLNASFGTTLTVRLVSGAQAVAAPPGGIVVSLTAVNPACVSVQSSAVIAAGFTNIVVPVTAAAGGSFPCTSLVRATGPVGFTADSLNASVAATPAITASINQFLGAGLQRNSNFSLGANNHGGTTVRVESADPTRLLIAPNVSTAGSAFIDIPVGIGGASGNFVLQALENGVADTVLVRFTAPGFVSDSFPTFIYQSAFEIVSLASTRTTAALDAAFSVRVGSTSTPTGTTLSSIDEVRVGGPPIAFSIINDSTGVADLVTTALTGDSVTVAIQAGGFSSPTSVATGGVAIRSQSAGVTRIRATHPSLRALPGAAITVTVTQASISSVEALSGTSSIGRGLQRAVTINLSDGAPTGGVPLTVKPSRAGFVLLSATSTAVGSADSVVLNVPQGGSQTILTLQVLEGAPLDTLSLLVSAPGFGSRVALVQVVQPVLQIVNDLAATGTTSTIDDPFRVQVGSPAGPTGSTIFNADVLRRGSGGMLISVINDSSAVGTLATSARVADSVTVMIPEGVGLSNGLVSAGGVAFRFLGQGVTTVRAHNDLTRELAGAQRQVTVTQPTISGLTSMGIGAGLQNNGSITLDAPAPAGGLAVRLTMSESGRFLLAPNATTLGTDTLVVTIAAGTTTGNFFAQALEVVPDTVVLTATATGFTSRTSNLFVWRPVVNLGAISTSYTTLSVDDAFSVNIGSPGSPNGNSIFSSDVRRFGAAPLVVTVVSSNGLVGRLVTSAVVADTVTTQIAAGATFSPSTVALGGVAFRPLTSGTTVVSVSIPGFTQSALAAGVGITISTPAINLAGINAVGAGLQGGASGSLTASQHGGINIIIKSSNPAVAKVARNITEVAADSIIVAVANGSAGFNYVIAGQDGALGQVSITARAQGFTDGSAAASIVTPAIELSGVATTGVAGGVDDPFIVRVGTPNGQLTSLASVQSVRVGSAGIFVSLASSDPTVARFVTSTQIGNPVAVTIAAGSSTSPSLVSSGGVALRPLAAGTAVVQPSATGFTRMTTTGSVTVTVSP